MDKNVIEANQSTNTIATRATGFVLLLVAGAILGLNWLTLLLIHRYFPLLIALTGPVITLGCATVIHPDIFNSISADDKDKPKSPIFRWLAIAAILMGIVLSLFIYLLKLT